MDIGEWGSWSVKCVVGCLKCGVGIEEWGVAFVSVSVEHAECKVQNV